MAQELLSNMRGVLPFGFEKSPRRRAQDMGNTIVYGSRRTFRATLFGVAMLIFGGTALAASAPSVGPLYLTGTNGTPLTDANGNPIPYKVATDYVASKVAVDNNGNVYVADAVSNTVSAFNTNGRLFREIAINKPSAIGVDDQNDRIYISGAFDGRIRSIYTFDKSGNGQGTLSQFAWENPSDIVIGSSGDIYVADNGLNVVKRLSAKGEREKKVFGPYGNQMNANESVYNIKTGANETVFRTRHRMRIVQGIAVDEISGNLYIGAKEWIETLNTGCNSVSSAATGDSLVTSGTALICYDDTEESWKYYYDLCPNGNCTNNSVTNLNYKSWNPMDGGTYQYTTKYHILIIDIKEKLPDGSDNPAYGTIKRDMLVADKGGDEWSVFMARGLSLDGQGRLYVAGVGCDGLGIAACATTPGKIKVYDVSVDITQMAPTLLSSSSFVGGIYNSVAFSPDASTGAPKGRLFATIGDNKIISAYAIDFGTNPANTAPTAPVLYDPNPNKSDAVVPTKKPTLKIVNATDPQNDPLTYAYEVYEINKNTMATIGNPITPPSMFAEEKANVGTEANPIYTTSMAINSDLKENSLYSWKARSFDGERGTWNAIEGVFCVDAEKENPTEPVIQKPLDGAIAPPLTTYLEWSPSVDPDCYGEVRYYTVEVSEDAAFRTILFSKVSNTPSVRLSDITGLINGMAYHWRAKAVDANGGVSYSAGRSFIYNYKTGAAGFGSDQSGTKVYIDGNYGYYGRFLGETPMEDVGGIAVGRHFVAFIKDGYEPYYDFVDAIDPAQKTTGPVIATMVPASRIKPSAAGVTLKDSNGTDITAVASSTPFVADYNNDGVKDLLVGGGDGRVYIYLSEKQTVDGIDKIVPLVPKGAIHAYDSDTQTPSAINVASNAVSFVVDYNDDGRKDLLIGSSDGYTYLCLNIGEDSAPVFALPAAIQDKDGSDIKAISNSAPAVVDYNNDGKKDLVVGSSDGTLRLYINGGSDESPEFGLPVAVKADGSDLNVGSDSRPFFTDWNSDGKKDLVVGDSSGKASLFFNVGADDVPEFKSIAGLPDWIKAKKKERGNREYKDYLGYNQDIGDLTGGSSEASLFIVDWSGTSARDIIVGNGSGSVTEHITK